MMPYVTNHKLNSLVKLSQLKYSFRFSLKAQLFWALRNQNIIMWRIIWLLLSMLSIPLPIQPSLLVGSPFYNSKSSKHNGLASLFKKKKKAFSYFWAFVRVPYSASAMARPCACCSLCWNLFSAGEDELAGAAPTEGSDTPIPTSAMSYSCSSYRSCCCSIL